MTGIERHTRVLLAWLLAGCALAAHAADADLDPAFGDGHQVTQVRPVEFGNGQAWVGDVATLPDGRIAWAMENGIGSLWVARMRRDGTFDPGFAGDGLLELDDCVGPRPVRIAPLDDGSLVAWTGRCLRRISADGTLDPAFPAAVGGPDPDFVAARLLRDAAGRWLLAGNDGQEMRVYRFLADGAPDPAFGDDGVATITTASTSGARTLAAMALRADGRIVLAGSRGNSHGPNLVVASLDASGAPDPAFGVQGIVDLDPPEGYNGIAARAIAVDRDGSLVVAGDGNNGMQSCCVLVARIHADGTVEPDALRLFPLGPNVTLSAFGETSNTLALLPHGKILLARVSFPFEIATRTRFTLVRLHHDGSLDAGFNDVGWRSYVVADPEGQGQSGPYSQIHGMAFANGEALMFGRTFFEDNAIGPDYVTLMRARMDALFEDGYEP
ncbi:MAG: hypothetical protein EOP90_07310 [Lysobacteraceae bacterium]|nr:MAG: hypothetical protein EOP90_07310 [Xanthomonadaceae bacterium]